MYEIKRVTRPVDDLVPDRFFWEFCMENESYRATNYRVVVFWVLIAVIGVYFFGNPLAFMHQV